MNDKRKGYAVVSVRDLARLHRFALKNAKAQGHVNRTRLSNSCVVLEIGVDVDSKGDIQISLPIVGRRGNLISMVTNS